MARGDVNLNRPQADGADSRRQTWHSPRRCPAQTITKIKTGETCHLGEYQSFAVEDGTLWASSGHAPKLGKWCVSGLAGQSSTSLRRPFKVSASSRPTCRDAILSAIRPSSPPGA